MLRNFDKAKLYICKQKDFSTVSRKFYILNTSVSTAVTEQKMMSEGCV